MDRKYKRPFTLSANSASPQRAAAAPLERPSARVERSLDKRLGMGEGSASRIT